MRRTACNERDAVKGKKEDRGSTKDKTQTTMQLTEEIGRDNRLETTGLSSLLPALRKEPQIHGEDESIQQRTQHQQ